jgi:hypothetical protein
VPPTILRAPTRCLPLRRLSVFDTSHSVSSTSARRACHLRVTSAPIPHACTGHRAPANFRQNHLSHHHHFLPRTVCLFCPAYLRLHPWQPNWAASHVSQRMLGRWQHKSHHWAICMCLVPTCCIPLRRIGVFHEAYSVSPSSALRVRLLQVRADMAVGQTEINCSRHLTSTLSTAEETDGPGLSSYPDC